MSTLATPVGVPVRRTRLTGVGAWLRESRVPLLAVLGSRVLVLASGTVAAWLLPSHLHASAAAAERTHLGRVGDLLSATVDRWDAGWYLKIAEHGYSSAGAVVPQRLGFLPAYPLAIRVLTLAVRSPVLAGVALSLSCFTVAMVLLYRLCELELGRRAAELTVLLLALCPVSVFFSAIYTESPFLLLTVGSLYAMRTGRWRLACVLGAVSAVTRVTGIAIAPALAVGRWRRQRRWERGLWWAALVPGAVLVYMLVLALAHMPPLGILSAQNADWNHELAGPGFGAGAGLVMGGVGLWQITHGLPIYTWSSAAWMTRPADNLLLAFAFIALVAAVVVARRQRRLAPEYLLLLLATLVVCTSSPVLGVPLWSLDRYALTMVPAWMIAGQQLACRPRAVLPTMALSALGLIYCSAQFATGAWVA